MEKRKLLSAKEILLKSNILERIEGDKHYVSEEFQDYGLRLASKLNDLQHKALYINLAKNIPRSILDGAVQFALDYPKAHARAKMFMWKLHELCQLKNIKFPGRSKSKKVNKFAQSEKIKQFKLFRY